MATKSKKEREKRSKPEMPAKTEEDEDSNSTQKSFQQASSTSWIVYGLVGVALSTMVSAAILYSLKTYSLNTRLRLPAVISEDVRSSAEYLDRLWGTYRSGVYFGIRPRLPNSVTFGLMWVSPKKREFVIRHNCDQNEAGVVYGWKRHDGREFGEQEIIDKDLKLQTHYLKTGNNSWSARVSVSDVFKMGPANKTVTLMFYAYAEGSNVLHYTPGSKGGVAEITGDIKQLGPFRLTVPHVQSKSKPFRSFLATHLPGGLAHLSDKMKRILQFDVNKARLYLPGEVDFFPQEGKKDTNFVVLQMTVVPPLTFDVVYTPAAASPPAAAPVYGPALTRALEGKTEDFDQRFEQVFQLKKKKGFAADKIDFARSVFSNLIGGMSYFHGQSIVTSREMSAPLAYWPADLYTAVPSRSFFPRGFLWDEGFHQLVISKWSTSIAKDAVGHWLDLMNQEGWIPREQILGEEAISRVPMEFVVQHGENANPPTLFLALQSLIQQMRDNKEMDAEFLQRVYPRLKVWYNWFNTSQTGPLPTSYRWRGRNATTDRELNPKTLSSGLDDSPRATHPTPEERHLDLRCWMALASRVMSSIGELVGDKDPVYTRWYQKLSDNTRLDQLHWDGSRKMYSDYGLHSTDVKLAKYTPPPSNDRGMKRNVQQPYKYRNVVTQPTEGFVKSFGYINLFPFLLELIDPQSDKLGMMLSHIENTQLLWTKFGLRSLAKSDPFYNKYNTEHDPPYWRGSIWINMNYLALKSLHRYGNTKGPHQTKAASLYKKLRSSIIENMFRIYKHTGYVWEQYSDDLGMGKGTHPFTGWSSLVVLIMAEAY